MSAQAKRCMRWILAATCFFAVTFVAGHFYSSWMNRRFECSGIRTVAMVTDVTVEHHKEQYIRSYGAGKGAVSCDRLPIPRRRSGIFTRSMECVTREVQVPVQFSRHE